MEFKTDFIKSLMEQPDSVDAVGRELIQLWADSARNNNLEEHYYKGEESVKDFEDLFVNSYPEFYDALAKTCINRKNVFDLYPSAKIIVMDGMSLRESALLFNAIMHKGFSVKQEFNFSSVPSDTENFREKIGYSKRNFSTINSENDINSLTNDAQLFWSSFPDILLDKIQVGHTKISSLVQMYETVEKIVFSILSKIEADTIIITSDHGYIMTESGLNFPLDNKAKDECQRAFGSKRYVSIGNLYLDSLVSKGYIKDFNGYYVAKSRYLWPVPGKYSIYIHGGLSLMECFTPVIVIER
jgi:hypothetical protein